MTLLFMIHFVTGNLVTLRNVENKSSVILNAPVNLSSTDVESVERLVFNKYGDQYLLAQISLTADSGKHAD